MNQDAAPCTDLCEHPEGLLPLPSMTILLHILCIVSITKRKGACRQQCHTHHL
jgi:hypothetical protein